METNPRPRAVFMAFGTKGDVYPLAAVAAALASDHKHYHVVFISHAEHQNLNYLLEAKNVSYIPVSTPSVLSAHQFDHVSDDLKSSSFAMYKTKIKTEHKQECLSAIAKVFGDDPCLKGDFIVINFFALEGWNIAELYQIQCVVAAPYVVPYSYGFSKEIVECPGYWPSNAHVCGFWFLPLEWQFSCSICRDIMSSTSSKCSIKDNFLCANHTNLQSFFIGESSSCLTIFIGLSSIGSMGFIRNPEAFLSVLEAVITSTSYRFILFSAEYEPLDAAINLLTGTSPAVVHHGGSGTTAAALHAGVPQILCPFILDQFYWAERLYWLGVAPAPLERHHLVPDSNDATIIKKAADKLTKAIKLALSPTMKEQALKIAENLSAEDGIAEALKILKEQVIVPAGDGTNLP